MICSRCGADNREGSNFCRLCSTPLAAQMPEPNSGYSPTVPPPDPNPYGAYYQPPPPQPMPRPVVGQRICPRCGSPNIIKGSTPLWAILVAVIGFFFICFLSLFFLLVKEPNKCLNCGLDFK